MIVSVILINFVLVSCKPSEESIKALTTKVKLSPSSISQQEQVKDLEPMLKTPTILKDSVLLHRQCAALSFPNKLLAEALVLSRTNVFKQGDRTKVSCITLLPENPKGVENISGDLVIFGVYEHIDYMVSKLPSDYLLNIEQRSEKNPETIYPWIIKKL